MPVRGKPLTAQFRLTLPSGGTSYNGTSPSNGGAVSLFTNSTATPVTATNKAVVVVNQTGGSGGTSFNFGTPPTVVLAVSLTAAETNCDSLTLILPTGNGVAPSQGVYVGTLHFDDFAFADRITTALPAAAAGSPGGLLRLGPNTVSTTPGYMTIVTDGSEGGDQPAVVIGGLALSGTRNGTDGDVSGLYIEGAAGYPAVGVYSNGGEATVLINGPYTQSIPAVSISSKADTTPVVYSQANGTPHTKPPAANVMAWNNEASAIALDGANNRPVVTVTGFYDPANATNLSVVINDNATMVVEPNSLRDVTTVDVVQWGGVTAGVDSGTGLPVVRTNSLSNTVLGNIATAAGGAVLANPANKVSVDSSGRVSADAQAVGGNEDSAQTLSNLMSLTDTNSMRVPALVSGYETGQEPATASTIANAVGARQLDGLTQDQRDRLLTAFLTGSVQQASGGGYEFVTGGKVRFTFTPTGTGTRTVNIGDLS